MKQLVRLALCCALASGQTTLNFPIRQLAAVPTVAMHIETLNLAGLAAGTTSTTYTLLSPPIQAMGAILTYRGQSFPVAPITGALVLNFVVVDGNGAPVSPQPPTSFGPGDVVTIAYWSSK